MSLGSSAAMILPAWPSASLGPAVEELVCLLANRAGEAVGAVLHHETQVFRRAAQPVHLLELAASGFDGGGVRENGILPRGEVKQGTGRHQGHDFVEIERCDASC